MKIRICIIFLVGFCTIGLQALPTIESRIDSLQKLLDTTKIDSIKVDLLWMLSHNYMPIDTVMAFLYAQKIRDIGKHNKRLDWESKYYDLVAATYSNIGLVDKRIKVFYEQINFHKQNNNPSGVANSYRLMGEWTMHQNRYWDAICYLDTCISIMQELGIDASYTVYSRGYCYARSGNYEMAQQDFFEALYLRRATNHADTAKSLAAIAFTYEKIGEFDKAKEYFEIGEQACIDQERHYTHASLLNDLANMYYNIGDTKNALKKLNRSIDKWRYIKEHVPLVKTSDDLGIVEAWVLRSKLYQGLKLYKRAKADIDSALSIANSSLNLEVLVWSHLRHGEFLFFQKKYKQAINALESAYQYSLGTNLTAKQRDITSLLAKIYDITGEHKKAFSFLNLSKSLSDSILNQEKLREINRLEYQFVFDKKEAELICEQEQDKQRISLLENELLLKQQTQLILWGGIAATLIIAGLLILFFYNRYIAKSKLAIKQAELNRQKLIEAEKTQKLLAAKFMIEGQEKERERLARDLHDDLGSQLAAIKLHLENMDSDQSNEFHKTKTRINNAYEDVRRISHNLMPLSLSQAGLPSAVRDLSQNISTSKKLHIDVQTIGLENRLDATTEVMLFRIIQEAMKNIIRHAEAQNVVVQIINDGNLIALTIEDDGKGFDMNKKENKEGLGMKSIKSRVEFMNGKLDIRSKEGEGTSIYVEVGI